MQHLKQLVVCALLLTGSVSARTYTDTTEEYHRSHKKGEQSMHAIIDDASNGNEKLCVNLLDSGQRVEITLFSSGPGRRDFTPHRVAYPNGSEIIADHGQLVGEVRETKGGPVIAHLYSASLLPTSSEHYASRIAVITIVPTGSASFAHPSLMLLKSENAKKLIEEVLDQIVAHTFFSRHDWPSVFFSLQGTGLYDIMPCTTTENAKKAQLIHLKEQQKAKEEAAKAEAAYARKLRRAMKKAAKAEAARSRGTRRAHRMRGAFGPLLRLLGAAQREENPRTDDTAAVLRAALLASAD